MVDQDVSTEGPVGTGGGDATLRAGPLQLGVSEGRLRVHWAGTEVVRQIDCPIRDNDWRTLATEELEAGAREAPGGFNWHRSFRTLDGSVAGDLVVEGRADASAGWLSARLSLSALESVDVNRAGFVLLHPIAGVAGTPLEVQHPDGRNEAIRFPARVSPAQPVLDIAGLRHRIDAVEISIAFEGEVFEMEDQRNWTDASFKTYSRPLSRPRPYRLEAGHTVSQAIHVTLRSVGAGERPPAAAAAPTAVMPRITLAHDPALPGEPPAALAGLKIDGLLLRLDARDPAPGGLPLKAPVSLEIVTDIDASGDIAAVSRACRAAGLVPRRVIAVPRAYLASHQPDGPWPAGPTPMDLVQMLRDAFPGAAVGGGMLTNFTEFNRCPPDAGLIDFASFGTTAIVHAADDRAVLETLEALPQVFESARALVPGRPLHLGLLSIGMRSNPYGAAVAANPDCRRTPMAMDDPRQREPFAAAFAIGAVAAAARAGIASLAPAMTAGLLGLGSDGDLWPLFDAIAALAALGGHQVEISGEAFGPVVIRAQGRGVAANLGHAPLRVAGVDVGPMSFAVFGDLP